MVYKANSTLVTYFFRPAVRALGSMRLAVALLLACAAAASAAPAKKPDDMMAAEGRSHPAYSAPYHPAPAGYAPQKQSHGTISSYNRRGPSALPHARQDSGYPKPETYHGPPAGYGAPVQPQAYHGPSPGYGAPAKPEAYHGPPSSGYGAPVAIKAQPSIRAPVSYSGHTNYAPYHQQEGPAGYGAFGPQKNEYSAQSQQYSQDPSYDAAKDPVSQYADYVPVREYGSKGIHSDGRELSLYGYKK